MNGWAVFFLGVIALATLVTAVLQIGLILYAGRLVRRLTDLADEIQRELKPLFAAANTIGRDAARVASLAVSQMERADRVFANVATCIEEMAVVVQKAVLGRALLDGLRAALAVLRRMRGRPRKKHAEDEETLFI
jgi:hypothetical protein